MHQDPHGVNAPLTPWLTSQSPTCAPRATAVPSLGTDRQGAAPTGWSGARLQARRPRGPLLAPGAPLRTSFRTQLLGTGLGVGAPTGVPGHEQHLAQRDQGQHARREWGTSPRAAGAGEGPGRFVLRSRLTAAWTIDRGRRRAAGAEAVAERRRGRLRSGGRAQGRGVWGRPLGVQSASPVHSQAAHASVGGTCSCLCSLLTHGVLCLLLVFLGVAYTLSATRPLSRALHTLVLVCGLFPRSGCLWTNTCLLTQLGPTYLPFVCGQGFLLLFERSLPPTFPLMRLTFFPLGLWLLASHFVRVV